MDGVLGDNGKKRVGRKIFNMTIQFGETVSQSYRKYCHLKEFLLGLK